MLLLQDKIDQIFEEEESKEHPHQANILIALYRYCFPDYDDIEKLDKWPIVTKNTSIYISSKFIDFDKKYHPKVLPGGLWLNNGFSSKELYPEGKDIKDWEVDLSRCNVIYKKP